MEKSMELGGSEQGSSSDDWQLVDATVTKMMQKEVELIVIRAVRQEIGPIVEDLLRKVVKEEIESAQEKFSGVNRNNSNDVALSKEGNLKLKFLDEVSLPVPTGKLIKGKGGTYISVALVDQMSEEVVKSRPESSAKVEILLLDNNDHKCSLEDFNNRIIKEGDKTKPHFAKRVFVDLADGIGIVDNAKLGHDSKWMKKFECCLGARMENFNGVQEASTKSFVVSDCRGEIQKKSESPRLSDSVCRLKNIGKATGKHLNANNIKTVKDFLTMLSIDPQKLQQIVFEGAKWKAAAAPAKWKATVEHAQTCIVDDKTVSYYESPDINMGIAFDVVGVIKGLIQHPQFIPYDKLSGGDKDFALKLLLSAYENPEDIKSFEEENALLHQFSLIPPCYPYGSPSSRLDHHCSETCGDNSTLNFPDEDNNIMMNNTKYNASYPYQQSSTIRFFGATTCMLWTLKVRKKSMALGGIHVQKKQRSDQQ